MLLALSERAVIDALFEAPGQVFLEHRTPDHVYDLGAFTVTEGEPGAATGAFEALRTDPELTAEHHSIGPDLERPPDKVLAFYSLMPLLYGGDDTQASCYACPMHPEVTAGPLACHAHSGRRWMWPCVAFTCGFRGCMWPGVAWCRSTLAPHLAPTEFLSAANFEEPGRLKAVVVLLRLAWEGTWVGGHGGWQDIADQVRPP